MKTSDKFRMYCEFMPFHMHSEIWRSSPQIYLFFGGGVHSLCLNFNKGVLLEFFCLFLAPKFKYLILKRNVARLAHNVEK